MKKEIDSYRQYVYCRLLYHFVRAVVQRKKKKQPLSIKSTKRRGVKKAEKQDINSVHLRDKDTSVCRR